MKYIAILLTVHNRKEKTLTCLSHLYNAMYSQGYSFDIFLVDDGSFDGTKEAVHNNFPEVVLIQGSGGLYWNGGMRLAWQHAIENEKDYQGYIWLNDDTILNNGAFYELFNVAEEAFKIDGSYPIVVGACQESLENDSFSYGGRFNDKPVVPNGELQKCTRINGNFVLIPKSVFIKLGILSAKYTHGMGDYDYSARAEEVGIKCYTTTKYIGICASHEKLPTWCDPNKSIRKRWENFHHPLGLNIKEYKEFVKIHRSNWRIELIKAYAKLLIPKLYQKLIK